MELINALEVYIPWNAQERADRDELLRRLRSGEALYGRENRVAHLTASAWVISPDRRQVLMAYHNLYNSWAWLGGHADGERDLLGVALREVSEESGLTEIRPVTTDIYSLEILTVDGHEKRGEYVSSHLHLNVTYLLEADPRLTGTTAPRRLQQPRGMVYAGGGCCSLLGAVVPGADLPKAERQAPCLSAPALTQYRPAKGLVRGIIARKAN